MRTVPKSPLCRALPLLAICMCGALSGAATAAGRYVEPYESWPTYQVVQPLMSLPRGFHDFLPVPKGLRFEIASEGNVLCSEMKTAISLGKRLGLGYRPEAAIREI